MKHLVPCPSCGSDKFYFVQMVKAFYTIECIEGEGVDTFECVDEIPHDDYKLFCKACEWEGGAEEYQQKLEERHQNDES